MSPSAVQWILAVLVFLLAGGVIGIVLTQLRIAKAQHNVELYDKRFQIFQSAKQLIRQVTSGEISDGDVREYDNGTSGAVFLFENDVNIYLEDLRRRSLRLMALVNQLSASEDNADGRNEVINQLDAWIADFKLEHSRLVKNFTPYLKNQPF